MVAVGGLGISVAAGAGLWLLLSKRDDSFATFSGHPGVVRGIAFIEGGKSIVSVGDQGHIQAWNIASRQSIFKNSTAIVNLNAIAVSGSGNEFATVGKDGFLSVWATSTGNLIVSQEIAKKPLECLAWHPKSDFIATGGFEKDVMLLTRQDLKNTKRLKGHTKHVHGVAFEADGKRLLSGSEDGTVLVWNAAGGSKLGSLSLGLHHINGMCPALNSNRIIVCVAGDGVAMIEGQPSQKLNRSFEGCGLATCLAVSTDGTTLVTGHENGDLRVWNESGGAVRKILVGHSTNVKCVAISPDVTTIASGCADGLVKLWSMVN